MQCPKPEQKCFKKYDMWTLIPRGLHVVTRVDLACSTAFYAQRKDPLL